MRDFNKVCPTFWQPNGAHSDEHRLLEIYFLTCPHQNSAGAFSLPEGYACADLGWDVQKFRRNRDALIESGDILHDAETSEYLILNWFEHNPLMNQKHAAGAKRLAERLQSDELKEKALRAIDAHSPIPTVQQTRYATIPR